MTAEELRAAFESFNNDDFVSSFDFEDNRAWVCHEHGLLTDECLEIVEDADGDDYKYVIRMTGDTSYYRSLEDAIDQLLEDWWS